MHYNIGNHFRKREFNNLITDNKETLIGKKNQSDPDDDPAAHYDIKPGDIRHQRPA